MGRFFVGLGLVVMLSALATYGIVTDAGEPSGSRAAFSAFWIFLVGAGIATAGALQAAR